MTDLLTENARLRAALAELRRGIAMIHDALATPSRPRQSVGEVAAWWLNYADAALATPAPDAPCCRPQDITDQELQEFGIMDRILPVGGLGPKQEPIKHPAPDAVQEAARVLLRELGDYDRNRSHRAFEVASDAYSNSSKPAPFNQIGDAVIAALRAIAGDRT